MGPVGGNERVRRERGAMMAYIFDTEAYIKKYTEMYDKLPDHPDAAKNKDPQKRKQFDGPSKENVPKPEDHKKQIEKVIEDNKNETACASCPNQGKCNKINWKADHSFVRVTGCSGHPDQKKFPGHSTTVVITDTTVSTVGGHGGDWDTAHDFPNWEVSYQNILLALLVCDGGWYYVCYRSMMIFNGTGVIPAAAIVDSAFCELYAAILDGSSGGSRDTVVMVKGGVTYPHNPVVDTDYNITNYSGECGSLARASFTIGAYHDIPFSDLTAITVNGITRFAAFYAPDLDDEQPPNVAAQWGVEFIGPTGANPPKLKVTYDVPAPGGRAGAGVVGYGLFH